MSPLDLGAGGSSPNDLERQNESFQRTQALLGASGVNWTPRRRVRGYTKDSGNKAVRAALWRMLRRCASTVDADRLVMVAYVPNGLHVANPPGALSNVRGVCGWRVGCAGTGTTAWKT